MNRMPLAIQLYTLREALSEDLDGALRRVKSTGYDYVEVAGLHGLSPESFGERLRAAGLTAMSMHVPVEMAIGNPDETAAWAKTLDVGYVVAPWVDPSTMTDEGAWETLGQKLNAAGARLRELGVRLCYHNHDFEMTEYGERRALDVLLSAAAPENLGVELDVYWVEYGGGEATRYFRRYGGRCPLVHLKDMAEGPARGFAPVGQGVLDMPAIVRSAREAEAQWLIVEQDETEGDPFIAIAASARYLKAL